jgi:hypothetical protein
MVASASTRLASLSLRMPGEIPVVQGFEMLAEGLQVNSVFGEL